MGEYLWELMISICLVSLTLSNMMYKKRLDRLLTSIEFVFEGYKEA